MPHYKDGTPAEVGDFVKGKPYNTPNEIVGQIVQITEGTESCNCIVAFTAVTALDIPAPQLYSVQPLLQGISLVRRKGGRIPVDGSGDQAQELIHLASKCDYGEVKAFTKIG